MANTSTETLASVFNHIKKQGLAEFTITDVIDTWRNGHGAKPTFRRAFAELVTEGAITKIGTRKSPGMPGLYALTETLEKMTAPEGNSVTVKKAKSAEIPAQAVVKLNPELGFANEFYAVLGMHADPNTSALYFEGLEKQLGDIITTAGKDKADVAAEIVRLKKHVDDYTELAHKNYKDVDGKIGAILNSEGRNADRIREQDSELSKLRRDFEEHIDTVAKRLNKRDEEYLELAGKITELVDLVKSKEAELAKKPDELNGMGFREGYRIGFADGRNQGVSEQFSVIDMRTKR